MQKILLDFNISGSGWIFRTKCDFLQVLDLLIFRQQQPGHWAEVVCHFHLPFVVDECPSRRLAIAADMGNVVDMEFLHSVAVVEVGCNIDELVADIETCGEKDHCCEECDCVHSCIFFNC